jgi:predicted transport protein
VEKGLIEKTGKDLNHWIQIIEKSGIDKHKAMIDYLKSEYGFTYGYANFVAMKSRKADAGSIDNDELLSKQYLGKENLRPIYDKLQHEILKFAKDATITPKVAAVSFIGKRQFALIKPATKTRIDLGLKLPGVEITERLENSGPFGTMCTHRVQITNIDQIDQQLLSWLKQAYQMST